MKIIIVEDEAAIREGMEGILKKLSPSYEVIGKAENGREGLSLIRSLRPDVILLDIRMPDMDGLSMLGELREEGIDCQALILTAYSDFGYAKQALELGVQSYLLKPVRVGELKRAMETAEKRLIGDEKRDVLLNRENMVRGAMTGILTRSEETVNALEKSFQIREEDPLGLFVVWLGADFEKNRDITARILGEVSGHAEGFDSMVTSFGEHFHFSMLVYHMEEGKDWESYFASVVVPMLETNTGNRALCAWADCSSIFELAAAGKRLYQIMDWRLTLGPGALVSDRAVRSVQVYPLGYPPEMNTRLKRAVVRRNADEFSGCMTELMAVCQKEYHDPKEIKENILIFLWTIVNTAREYMALEESGLKLQSVLAEVMNAFTWEKMESILQVLFDFVIREKKDSRRKLSPLIQKAKRLIEEYYGSQITLEEAARQLSVSPEYLSRLYKKETGLSFSEDLRRLKVEKVKTLLLGTTLNLTKIAAMTGFSDPKYMSKVFKDEVGVLPAEYRKIST